MTKKHTVLIDGVETVCGLTIESISFFATFYYANGGQVNDCVEKVRELFERVTVKPV